MAMQTSPESNNEILALSGISMLITSRKMPTRASGDNKKVSKNTIKNFIIKIFPIHLTVKITVDLQVIQ